MVLDSVISGWTMDGGIELLLILQHLVPFLETNARISIDVQSSNNGDDLGLTCPETVHTTEIHDVVVVEDAFSPIINCLECLHVRPVYSTFHIVLELLDVHVVLDFVLEQKGNLLLDSEAEFHMPRAVMTRPLRDHRAHVQIVTRQQDFHPPKHRQPTHS